MKTPLKRGRTDEAAELQNEQIAAILRAPKALVAEAERFSKHAVSSLTFARARPSSALWTSARRKLKALEEGNSLLEQNAGLCRCRWQQLAPGKHQSSSFTDLNDRGSTSAQRDLLLLVRLSPHGAGDLTARIQRAGAAGADGSVEPRLSPTLRTSAGMLRSPKGFGPRLLHSPKPRPRPDRAAD